jgi:mRNA-degrading endonuclease toxin of MazEF toxin-antitoxin module
MNNIKVANIIKRGEVWLADLSGSKGSEQGGIRPVLIVSNEMNNLHSPTVTIVPLTSKETKNKIPTHVKIQDEYILPEVSIALVEQIKTIDKVRVIKYMGKTTDAIMIEIEKAIDIQMAMHKNFDYSRAYKMIETIKDLQKEVKELGNRPRLVSILNKEIEAFKMYCSEYNKDYKFILEEYKKHNKTVA